MSALNALKSISPIDGRYAGITATAVDYFSEYALIKYRIRVETEYFLALAEAGLPGFPALMKEQRIKLRERLLRVQDQDILAVKEIEGRTNHDVKAVEYFIQQVFEELGLPEQSKAFIHFGLTSQDINNTAIPLSIKEWQEEVGEPLLQELIQHLRVQAEAFKDVPMLARTHGQAASPTRMGKEWMVFVERLENQARMLQSIDFQCKFGGATGNFNAHYAAYPQLHWPSFADKFCRERLGLARQRFTTQIEHYDMLGAFFDTWKRIAVILVDFCRDVWQYISMDYFRQRIRKNEVGSSAMPHKVNPIDFENAEGNLLWSIPMLEFFPAKLPVSRLQRDLTDSTVLRNIGVPFSHLMIALSSIKKGLGKIKLNPQAILDDLDRHPEVIAEAIQTILRREGLADAYDKLKEFSRTGESLSLSHLQAFVRSLGLSGPVEQELLNLHPRQYLGDFLH